MIGAALGYLEVVAMLIEHKANLNSKDKNGNTGACNGFVLRMATFAHPFSLFPLKHFTFV